MSVEPDNIIQDANDSGVSSDGDRSVRLDGSIDFGNDIDLYEFQADAGENVILDLDANEFGSALDGRLRLFDRQGNELGSNDDRPAPGEASSLDPLLSFTPSSSDIYYVGISDVGNGDYDPNVISDELSTQAVVGEYTLEISLADDTVNLDPDNTIAQAIATGLDAPGEAVSFEDEIDNLADVDIYQLQLAPGDALVADVDAAAIGSDLFASDIRLFNAQGEDLTELAIVGDSRLSKETRPSRVGGDPQLTFIADVAGDYYLGISGGALEPPTYNPINGINADASVASGAYELNLGILTVTEDTDPDNTIDEAIAQDLNRDGESTIINDTIENGDDVDIYQVQLNAGSTVTFDIDTENPSIFNDLELRLFDSEGQELAIADDDFVSLDVATTDPFLAFDAEVTGDYYVGIGVAENSAYDPVAGTTNLPRNQEVGGAEYFLNIDLLASGLDFEPTNPDLDAERTITMASSLELIEPGDLVNVESALNTDQDIDLYQVELEAGEVFTVDIDTEIEANLDTRLRLFNAAGNELASSDDDPALGEESSEDPFLAFTANIAGDYYVGVSEFANAGYDPIDLADSAEGEASLGEYTLEASLSIAETDSEPAEPEESLADQDNTIAQAIATELNELGESATFSQTITPVADVDVYQVQLDLGEGLILDLDAAELLPPKESASGLDSLIRIFDADGKQLAIADDDPAPGEEFSLDSFLRFIPSSSGNYYVGVSSQTNADYNPLTGETFNLGGGNPGDYNLDLEIVEVETIDQDVDNTISEAIAVTPNSAGKANFSDQIEPETDVDLYQIQLEAGDSLTLDLDANETGSKLDSALRLFDAAGNELLTVDDAAAPGEASSLDPWLQFTAESSGAYYVGVSDFGNLKYDPNAGVTNLSEPKGNTSGSYELNIAIAESAEAIEDPATDNINEPVLGNFTRLTGTDNSDVLFGNAEPTLIDALGGDDVVTGASNDDYFIGGTGSDILSGNKGNDTLLGGAGFDVLSGGEGNDFLQGDEDSNTLFGGAGADIFAIGELGNNTIADFESDVDRLQLPGNLSFADLTIEPLTQDSGVVITSDSSTSLTTIPGIKASSLSAADFISG